MAIAPHHLAIESGNQILSEGGNAIEACIAMAATLSAVYPHMTGIGGDSFWLLQGPGEPVHAIHACGRSAKLANVDQYHRAGLKRIPYRGPMAAITMAGTLSGWQQALEYSTARWQGRMPLHRLLSDAIGFCRHGYPVTPSQATATAEKFDDLIQQGGFADVYLNNGRPPKTGELVSNPALADTLQQLLDAGLEDYYHGDLAKQLAEDLESLGSPIRLEDFRLHRAETPDALCLQLPGSSVYTTAAPTQGLATLLILALFSRRPPGLAGQEGVDMLHWLVEATKPAFAIRNRLITDPVYSQVDATELLQDEYLTKLSKQLDPKTAAPWNSAMDPSDTT